MAINSSLSAGGFCQLRGEQTVGRCVLAKSAAQRKRAVQWPGRLEVAAWITPAFCVPPLPCLRPYHVKISGRRLVDCDPRNAVWRARRDSNCSTNILVYREFFAKFWSAGQVEGQDGGRLEVEWSVKI